MSSSEPDATALISALVAIYLVFITASVTLLADLAAPSERPKPEGETRRRVGRERLVRLTVVLLVATIGIDFMRIENSLMDLLATTLRTLDGAHIRDAAHEAQRGWFPWNFFVVVLALIGR